MKLYFINCLGIILLPKFAFCGNLNNEILETNGYNNHHHLSQSIPSSLTTGPDLKIIKVQNNDHDYYSSPSSSATSTTGSSGSIADEQIIRVIHEEVPSVLYQSPPLVQEQQTQSISPETSVVRIIKEHSSQSLPSPLSHDHHHYHHQPSIDTISSEIDNNNNNHHHHHHHQSEKVIKVIHEEASTTLHPVQTGTINQHPEHQQTIVKLFKEHTPHQQQQQQSQSFFQNGQYNSEKFFKIIHEEPAQQSFQAIYETPNSNQYIPPLTTIYQQASPFRVSVPTSIHPTIHQQPNLPVLHSIRPTYSFNSINPIFQQHQQPQQHHHQQPQFHSDIYHPNSKIFKLIHQITPIQQSYQQHLQHPNFHSEIKDIKVFKIIRPTTAPLPPPRTFFKNSLGSIQNSYYQQHPEQRVKVIKVVHEPIIVPQVFPARSHGWT